MGERIRVLPTINRQSKCEDFLWKCLACSKIRRSCRSTFPPSTVIVQIGIYRYRCVRDGFNTSRTDHIKCGQKPGAKWDLTELIPYSRQKKTYIFYDKFKVTHLSHNSPFRFQPSHVCRRLSTAWWSQSDTLTLYRPWKLLKLNHLFFPTLHNSLGEFAGPLKVHIFGKILRFFFFRMSRVCSDIFIRKIIKFVAQCCQWIETLSS